MYGNRIREARKKKGMTLKQVADATGYTIGHISQIERNLKSPSLSALRKIAACLECSEVWLIMGGSDDAPLAQADGEGGSRESFLIDVYKRQVLYRATALSYLICMYIKEYSGKLSAFCGCGIAAGTGMACALVYLWGGDDQMLSLIHI